MPSPSERPLHLMRQFDLHSELLRESPHQCWVLLEPPPGHNYIRPSIIENLLSSFARVDAADGANDQLVADGLLDCFSEGSLVSWFLGV